MNVRIILAGFVVGLAGSITTAGQFDSTPNIIFHDALLRTEGNVWDIENYSYLSERLDAGDSQYGYILSSFTSFNRGGFASHIGIEGGDYGEDLDVTVSYQDAFGDWHSFDDRIHGEYSDWIRYFSLTFDYQQLIVTAVSDPRDTDPRSSVPGIPAPSGLALLAISGVGCTRRRHR